MTMVPVDKVLIHQCRGILRDNGMEVHRFPLHLLEKKTAHEQKIHIQCFCGGQVLEHERTATIPILTYHTWMHKNEL